LLRPTGPLVQKKWTPFLRQRDLKPWISPIRE
jgi:hypothetical protein